MRLKSKINIQAGFISCRKEKNMSDINIGLVQDDMVVVLDYVLTVDGNQVDANSMPYLHGHGNIIPGLETAVSGMKIGETREVLVKAEDAYGEYDDESIVNINRDSFPKDFEIKLGHPLRIRDENGHIYNGTITALGQDTIELDLNHPMAGKDLFFKATIADIREATPEELANGHIQSGCNSCASDGCSSDCCG
jgi:FKBP-type peptidyl-prolyl cis-trans isomerase SlyD